MTSILLIYPFFKRSRDRSVFRFPPLGICYLAASLQRAGHDVRLLDCTFLDRKKALKEAMATKAEVTGIYCMVTMLEDCLRFAELLRGHSKLLIAGGPLPTCDPEAFLDHFNVVVRGEGEQTIKDLIDTYERGGALDHVAGIAFRTRANLQDKGKIVFNSERAYTRDLDHIPFPARELLPNESYIRYGKKKYGHSITTIMSTRGCPYQCEFCSNVIFGGSYRERSPKNVVDEIETALALGYDRISFADDVFTMKKERVIGVCQEIKQRGLIFKWECLGRVDALDDQAALEMKEAGCTRIFFGIESGDEKILKLMNKKITPDEAHNAVNIAHRVGLQVGAFFILCYPGDTDETVLETLRFATSLPLDYLGLSMPYPLPGTDLYKRTKDRVSRGWHPDASPFGSHVLIFDADFSETKMWFAILKGHVQFEIKKRMGVLAPLLLTLFEKPTDAVFKLLR